MAPLVNEELGPQEALCCWHPGLAAAGSAGFVLIDVLAAVCFPRRSERGTRKGRAVCSLNQCDQKQVVVYSPGTMLVPVPR